MPRHSYHFSLTPISHIGQSSPIVVNVFLAISKLAIPPMAFLLWEKYVFGSDNTISMPNASRLSAYRRLGSSASRRSSSLQTRTRRNIDGSSNRDLVHFGSQCHCRDNSVRACTGCSSGRGWAWRWGSVSRWASGWGWACWSTSLLEQGRSAMKLAKGSKPALTGNR